MFQLNSLVFPSPPATYTFKELEGNIVYIPRKTIFKHKSPKTNGSAFSTFEEEIDGYIPCLLNEYEFGSDKILLYFHGNAEDIGCSWDIIDTLKSELGAHILAVEYMGYGIYNGKANSGNILEDAYAVCQFLLEVMRVEASNIWVFGRSIGSGPATYIASQFKVGTLMLMSAFTSVKDAAKHVAGKFLASVFVKDRFKNKEHIKMVQCPIFLVHGMNDELIPYEMANTLCKLAKAPTELILRPGMTHNEYDISSDLINPLKVFMRKHAITANMPQDPDHRFLKFNEILFTQPLPITKKTKKPAKSKIHFVEFGNQ